MEKEKSTSGCIFKYYLFKEGDLSNPRVIPATSLDLRRIILLEYKNIADKDLTPNRIVLLFNALFDSNEELLNGIIMEYKNSHPKSKIDQENYSKVRLTASGDNSEGFNFIGYDENKNQDDDKKVRFVPIIFDSDFVRSRYNGFSNKADLINPRKVLMSIFGPKYSVDYSGKLQFDRELYEAIYEILYKKYYDRLEWVNEELNKRVNVRRNVDTLSVYNLLNSDIIKKLYSEDSYLFVNLLAVVAYHSRLEHLFSLIKKDYSIDSTVVGSRMQLQFSSRSISELRYDLEMLYITKPKNEELIVPIYTEEEEEVIEEESPMLGEELEYVPDLEEQLMRYNEKYLTNYTIVDVLNCDRLYMDITEQFERTHKPNIDADK